MLDPDERAGAPERLPLREAFRLLAPPPSSWNGPPVGPKPRELLWVDPVRAPARPSYDTSVQRLIEAPFATVVAALAVALRRDGWPRGLVVDVAHARGADGELRLPAGLRLHRCGHPLDVDVVVRPWSRLRTQLWLQARCRRRQHLPRRYFDAAHDAVDALRRAIPPPPQP